MSLFSPILQLVHLIIIHFNHKFWVCQVCEKRKNHRMIANSEKSKLNQWMTAAAKQVLNNPNGTICNQMQLNNDVNNKQQQNYT